MSLPEPEPHQYHHSTTRRGGGLLQSKARLNSGSKPTPPCVTFRRAVVTTSHRCPAVCHNAPPPDHCVQFNSAFQLNASLSYPTGWRRLPKRLGAVTGGYKCLRGWLFTGPWTVTRSSLRMLRRVAAVLSVAAGCAPAGVVCAFAEPSGWCAGAVLVVAGCTVCGSAAPSSWRIGGCGGCCGSRLTVFAVHTRPSSGRPQPASLVPCSSTLCPSRPPHTLPHSVGPACAGRVPCCLGVACTPPPPSLVAMVPF